MTKFLQDYECPEHGVFEGWGSNDALGRCPKCNRRLPRLIGAKGILLSFKGDTPGADGFPRASRMWAEAHYNASKRPEKDAS